MRKSLTLFLAGLMLASNSFAWNHSIPYWGKLGKKDTTRTKVESVVVQQQNQLDMSNSNNSYNGSNSKYIFNNGNIDNNADGNQSNEKRNTTAKRPIIHNEYHKYNISGSNTGLIQGGVRVIINPTNPCNDVKPKRFNGDGKGKGKGKVTQPQPITIAKPDTVYETIKVTKQDTVEKRLPPYVKTVQDTTTRTIKKPVGLYALDKNALSIAFGGRYAVTNNTNDTTNTTEVIGPIFGLKGIVKGKNDSFRASGDLEAVVANDNNKDMSDVSATVKAYNNWVGAAVGYRYQAGNSALIPGVTLAVPMPSDKVLLKFDGGAVIYNNPKGKVDSNIEGHFYFFPDKNKQLDVYGGQGPSPVGSIYGMTGVHRAGLEGKWGPISISAEGRTPKGAAEALDETGRTTLESLEIAGKANVDINKNWSASAGTAVQWNSDHTYKGANWTVTASYNIPLK